MNINNKKSVINFFLNMQLTHKVNFDMYIMYVVYVTYGSLLGRKTHVGSNM